MQRRTADPRLAALAGGLVVSCQAPEGSPLRTPEILLAMARAARSMGKQVMVGNMGGSTLAMAPGFVLAQLCDVVDLDGPANLADDVLANSIYSDGRIFVPEAIWGAQAVRS